MEWTPTLSMSCLGLPRNLALDNHYVQIIMFRAVTVEYQRQRAKEMRQYFIDLRTEELRGKTQ